MAILMGSAWLWLFFRASAAQAEKDGEFRKTKNAFKATLSGAGWIQIVYESINDRTSFMESHSGGITSGKPDVFRKGNDFVFLGDVNYALYYQDNRPENTTGYATLKRIDEIFEDEEEIELAFGSSSGQIRKITIVKPLPRIKVI